MGVYLLKTGRIKTGKIVTKTTPTTAMANPANNHHNWGDKAIIQNNNPSMKIKIPSPTKKAFACSHNQVFTV